jgi:hypothetical protein
MVLRALIKEPFEEMDTVGPPSKAKMVTTARIVAPKHGRRSETYRFDFT